jgi:hypothetical protein
MGIQSTVGASDLDSGATIVPRKFFGFGHQTSTDALALELRVYRQRADATQSPA